MASHNNEECLHVTSETYQEILRHAAHDHLWAQYFLLTSVCMENLKSLPTTPEQYEQVDPENLLIDALERLATAIATLLPGGINEFGSYLAGTKYQHRPPNRQ
jgi:hypothetical protein